MTVRVCANCKSLATVVKGQEVCLKGCGVHFVDVEPKSRPRTKKTSEIEKNSAAGDEEIPVAA